MSDIPSIPDINEVVARLAVLSRGEYDRMRKSESVKLGVRVATLDELVGELHQNKSSAKHLNGHTAVKAEADAIILNKGAPLDIARTFVDKFHLKNKIRTLHHQQSIFLTWTGTHYREYLGEELRADIYNFLDKSLQAGKEGESTKPFYPSTKSVNDILDALRAVCQLENTICAPCWLGENCSDLPSPTEIISCQNGLLHLETGQIFPHTPDFYATSALDFNYDHSAPDPTHWYKFLKDVWDEDKQVIDLLQEIFGYLLGNDSDQQKIPLMVGPLRSGKGTVGFTLGKLIGVSSMVSPVLASLEGTFGMAPLLGKKVALIADARLGGRADQQRIAERLLSISGEDIQTVERKHIDAWTGKLPTRFFIMSNELPRISDPSGALGSRFLVLTMTKSFFGLEDHGLKAKISAEMPGILNWAIEGWKRLKARKYFEVPDSSQAAIQQLQDLSSPIKAFIRERCVLGDKFSISVDLLFKEWEDWCRDEGQDHHGTKATFGRNLSSAVATIGPPRQKGTRDDRTRYYFGIGIIEKNVFYSDPFGIKDD